MPQYGWVQALAKHSGGNRLQPVLGGADE